MPVDLVTLADVTNVAPTVEEKKPAPPPDEQPAPPPPPPQLEPTLPAPEAELAPSEPDQKPPPPPKASEDAAPPENPALPREKPAPQQKFDLDSTLAMLQKRAPAPPPPPANAKVADTEQQGLGAANAFTADLKDILLSQMRQCWNVPAGAPNPEQLIVQVRVFLAQDGSVTETEVEPGTVRAEAANPYMRTAAEYAVRAIKVCSPYKHLPPEQYTAWREIVMTFDPSKMVGK